MKKITSITLLLFTFCTLGFAQSKVTFYTNHGNFVVETHDSLMPITAGNFISLVNAKYYDGIIFHRVISNFVIQGGDPLGTGYGGPGYTIPDEFDSTGQLSNIKQTLSMANSGPNTGGSQFFINLKNNTFLDYDKNPLTSAHPVFGIVKSNWYIVDTIANVPVNSDDKPIDDVIMDSVRVTGSFLSNEELAINKTVSKVYPNPATPESVLDIYAEQPTWAKIEMYSQEGKLMGRVHTHLAQGKTKIPLQNIAPLTLSKGIYFLHVTTSLQQLTHKIVLLK